MRTILSFFGINEKEHTKEVVAELLRIHPTGAKFSTHSFYGRMAEGSPETIAVQRVLTQAGLFPWDNRYKCKQPNEYEVGRYREYEDSDFEGLELMQVWPQVTIDTDYFPPWGWGIRHKEVKKRAHIARSSRGDSPIMVPDRVRRALVSEEFRGLTFRPLSLFRNSRNPDDEPSGLLDWSSVGEPWWIVESLVSMPPASPYLRRVHGGTGEVLPREGRGILREPGFDDIEYHFLRSELRAITPFDVAQDFESGDLHRIFVTQRFREFCKHRKLECGFKPVRIDED